MRCTESSSTNIPVTCILPLTHANLLCMPQASESLELVFREQYGRMIASLMGLSGSFDQAEESLQEAFTTAAANWEENGIPRNPAAWLTTVAHRKLLDLVRREKPMTVKQPRHGGE